MATKTGSVLLASTSNAAGGSTSSSVLDVHTADDAIITAQVTNGATGPTAGCTATLQISYDNTTFYNYRSGTAYNGASVVTTFAWDLPLAIAYAQVQFSGNTGQAVTVAAQAHVGLTV